MMKMKMLVVMITMTMMRMKILVVVFGADPAEWADPTEWADPAECMGDDNDNDAGVDTATAMTTTMAGMKGGG